MAVLTIRHVTPIDLDAARFHGAFLDGPKPGDRLGPGPDLTITGWVLPRDAPAAAVELLQADAVVGRAAVSTARPDLAAVFPGVSHAVRAGFDLRAAATGMTSLRLMVMVVLGDRTRTPIATIEAEREWQEADSKTGAPLVSVVVPCYRQSRFLADAIESVLAQSYPHFEIVVVDDGSPDNTAEVASRYPMTRYVRQANAGPAAARNAGLRHSQGAFVVFLDADDRLLPEALEIGLAALATRPECAFVSGQCHGINADGRWLTAEPGPVPSRDHYQELLRDCYIWMPGAVMFRRIALSAAGGFDGAFRSSADHELYLRIARAHPVLCHDRVIAEHRRHAGNMTAVPAINLRERIGLLRKHRAHAAARGGEYWRAYRDGLARSRRHYGEPIVVEILNAVRAGRWRPALAGLRVLTVYYPGGIVSVLLRLRRAFLTRARASRTEER
jgi:glycosyltransferase involved in cell wall biosynthesis